MTKRELPEGRRPLSASDSADLVKKMHDKLAAGLAAGDRISQLEELYEAARQDAKEAEEYTAELEAKLSCNTPTLQEAAKVLLPLAESRTLPFYLVEMPLTKDGNGPADIGIDASEMSYEVWEAGTLSTFGGARQLSSAIPEWLRTLAELKG